VSVKITIALINEIRDDAELTAMARVIEGAQREYRWQGFDSDLDKARFSAYQLRAAGFGRLAETEAESLEPGPDAHDQQSPAAVS
jgi:hypothetical protein